LSLIERKLTGLSATDAPLVKLKYHVYPLCEAGDRGSNVAAWRVFGLHVF
jgi:hypothetical protein